MPHKDFEDNFLAEQERKLSEGKQPHKKRPFTRSDKIRVIIKIHTGFDDRDCHILNTYDSSGEDRQHTMNLYDISKTQLYRILEKVDDTFDPPDPD